MSKQTRDLHAEIMNLCCNSLHAGSPNLDVQKAYAEGHKRARHDAAELANEFMAERDKLKEANRELLEVLEKLLDQYEYDGMSRAVEWLVLSKARAAFTKHSKGE